MIVVKTVIKPSNIHGMGLFADQFISKDSVIFEEEEHFTKKFTLKEVEYMLDIQREFIEHWGYLSNGVYKLSLDNDRFFNHSKNPNTYESDDEENKYTYAKRDIYPGEELTTNYNDFDYSKKPIK